METELKITDVLLGQGKEISPISTINGLSASDPSYPPPRSASFSQEIAENLENVGRRGIPKDPRPH
jgi:hypothetical protein